MSYRSLVRGVVFFTVVWSMTVGPASAQSLSDLLGAVTEQTAPQTEDAPAVEDDGVATGETPQVDAAEAGFALKEALLISAEIGVAQGSRIDGFIGNPDIRIPLPPRLEVAHETLNRFGLGPEVASLDLAMNRAAEIAASDAMPLLRDAIRDLLIEDPLATLGSGGSAATESLRTGAGETLLERLTPIVSLAMAQAGVGGAWDQLVQKGGNLVTQSGVTGEDLTPYVTGRTLDGLFILMAAEESAIRTDPAARTTPLLARVFSSPQSAATGAATGSQTADQKHTADDTQSALKQALEIGAIVAVEQASAVDGFFGDPLIRIPMPSALEKVGESLRNFGMGSVVDDFELSMNRAAEMASAEAIPILVDAVKRMTFDDAASILTGGSTAATDALRAKTEASLTEVFQPIITTKMEEAGVTRSYESLMERGGSVMAMFGGGSQPDLPAYVTSKALDGLFTLIAAEEAKIRADPVARTTALLQQIFGSLGGG